MPAQHTRRRRLEPPERRKLILDHAARLVGTEGAMAVNMARVAKEAGVSKPLIYAYFPNRIVLLKELLACEYRRMRREQIQTTRYSSSFEDFVRRTTRLYLQHCADRGPFIQSLLDEPALQGSVEKFEERDAVVEFLAEQVQRHINNPISRQELLTITEIGLGLSRAAGRRVSKVESIDELVELTTAMIVAAVDASSALIGEWNRRMPAAS